MTVVAEQNLARAHRLAQMRVAEAVLRSMRATWPLLSPADLDATFDRWLDAVLPALQTHRAASAQIAANYVKTSKTIALGDLVTVAPVLETALPLEAVHTSLLVTGPLSIKRALARGVATLPAVQTAEGSAAAAAMRHALNGGRQTITSTLAADVDARGWRRITSSKPCEFCQMLASRGGVYSKDTVHFQAHDGCSCTAAPAWR